MRSFATILTALSLPLYAFSAHHGERVRRHADLAVRARGDLAKRYDNARFTYYDITTGQVACGGYFQASDYVVALNSAQYQSQNYCFQVITITYLGVAREAKIVDECPGCPFGGLDLTQGLFVAMAGSTDEGVLTGSWVFGSGSPAEANQNPATTTPKHNTAPKYTPPPEYTPPPATTTQQTYTPHSSPRTTSTSTSTPPPPPPSSSTSTSKTSLSALATSPSSAYKPDLPATSTATSTSSVSFSIATPGPLAQPAAGAITNAGIPRTFNPCSISYTQCYLTIITLLYLHACYI